MGFIMAYDTEVNFRIDLEFFNEFIYTVGKKVIYHKRKADKYRKKTGKQYRVHTKRNDELAKHYSSLYLALLKIDSDKRSSNVE